jgi:hypothetical protein
MIFVFFPCLVLHRLLPRSPQGSDPNPLPLTPALKAGGMPLSNASFAPGKSHSRTRLTCFEANGCTKGMPEGDGN